MCRASGSYISTMQGEWEGSTLDLVLSAMQAFPDAKIHDISDNLEQHSY